MTIEQLIPILLQVSMGAIVFALALRASVDDVVGLLRNPSLLVRSILAMNVVMPVLAAVVAAVFDLRHEVEIALIVLAVSPVPPILPSKEFKSGGRASYAIGLLAVSALVAIATIPLTVHLLGLAFDRTVDVRTTTIVTAVFWSVLGPLLAGFVFLKFAPSLAARAAKTISAAGTVLLVLVCLPILWTSRHALAAQVGDYTLVAIVLFTLTGLAVGHALGGSDARDRTVLALSTASRHPGVALAIASAVSQDPKSSSGAVLLCFLTSTIATIPYAKWRQRASAGGGA